jgi:hypothetical protein
MQRFEQTPVVPAPTNCSIMNRVPKVIAEDSKIGSR